ncbi:MAG: nuclear transport factor 2 family protein [Cyclobacteriaceae bacterium]
MNRSIFAVLILLGCQPAAPDKAVLIEEVRAAEKAFNDAAADKSVKEAFLEFVDDEGVIKRGNKIIKGKTAIAEFFDNQTFTQQRLAWKPTFIDVSSSGDMAYTYGNFQFSALAADSTEINSEGIFHTVWKRNANGEWKFVYD